MYEIKYTKLNFVGNRSFEHDTMILCLLDIASYGNFPNVSKQVSLSKQNRN